MLFKKKNILLIFSVVMIVFISIFPLVFFNSKSTYSATNYYCPGGELSGTECILERGFQYDAKETMSEVIEIDDWYCIFNGKREETYNADGTISGYYVHYDCTMDAYLVVNPPECYDRVYNGTAQVLIAESEFYSLNLDNEQTEIGDYQYVATLNGKYVWSDDVKGGQKELTCKITTPSTSDEVISLYEPTSKMCNDLTYNGESQELAYDNSVGYDYYDNYGTNAGTYSVIVKLNEGYQWKDGTTDAVKFNCEIKQAVTTITMTPSELTGGNEYSGEVKVEVDSPCDGTLKAYQYSDGITIDGATSTTEKSYTFKYEVNTDFDQTETIDFTYDSGDEGINLGNCSSVKARFEYTASKTRLVERPTDEDCYDLYYNGQSQTLAKNDSEGGYVLSDYQATNAGTYKVTATLNPGYLWSDNSKNTYPQTFACEIKKAPSTITLTPSELTGETEYSGEVEVEVDSPCEGTLKAYQSSEGITIDGATSTTKKNWTFEYDVNTVSGQTETIDFAFILEGDAELSNCYSSDKARFEYTAKKPTYEWTVVSTLKNQNDVEITKFYVDTYISIYIYSEVAGTYTLTPSKDRILEIDGQDLEGTIGARKTVQIPVLAKTVGEVVVDVKFTPDDSKYDPGNKKLTLTVMGAGTGSSGGSANNSASGSVSGNLNNPIYNISFGNELITTGHQSQVSFSANTAGKITLTSSNSKIVSLSSTTYNVEANEEKIFKLSGLKSGTAVITVKFEPSDTTKYSVVEKQYTIEVVSNGSNTNVTTNPATGNILLFIVWIIGLGAIGYSAWTFRYSLKK